MEVPEQHPVKTQVSNRQYQLSFFFRLPSPARPRTPPITAPRPPPSAPPTAAPLAPSSATFSSSGDSGAFASCSGFAFESLVGFATFFARFFMIPINQQDAYRVAAGNGAITTPRLGYNCVTRLPYRPKLDSTCRAHGGNVPPILACGERPIPRARFARTPGSHVPRTVDSPARKNDESFSACATSGARGRRRPRKTKSSSVGSKSSRSACGSRSRTRCARMLRAQ